MLIHRWDGVAMDTFNRKTANRKKNGISAKSILIPAVIVILLMHASIVGNTIRINRMGQKLSAATQGNFTYTQTAKAFYNSSDLLADKARLYVSTGDEAYLNEYFLEMRSLMPRDTALAPQIAPIETDASREQLQFALQAAQRCVDIEYRAMRLCAEGLHADLSEYPELANAPLTGAEAALPDREKQSAAAALLVSTEYLQVKNQIGEHVDLSIQAVATQTAQNIGTLNKTMRSYQILQWSMTVTTIVILSVLCFLLYVLLISPLERSADEVQRGETVPPDKGLAEFRRLAAAYNELLHHRKMMETYLRQQSQTDPLTGLPNRLAFQNFVSELSWEKAHSSVIVFSLDVNGLKEANDQRGHTFGDALLRNSASCIQSALGSGAGKHCFRFGGDEFAAFWVDVPVSELEGALARFEKEQSEHEVSISVGCAYAEDLSETTVEQLFQEADKNMYDDKAEFHRRQAQEVLNNLMQSIDGPDAE